MKSIMTIFALVLVHSTVFAQTTDSASLKKAFEESRLRDQAITNLYKVEGRQGILKALSESCEQVVLSKTAQPDILSVIDISNCQGSLAESL